LTKNIIKHQILIAVILGLLAGCAKKSESDLIYFRVTKEHTNVVSAVKPITEPLFGNDSERVPDIYYGIEVMSDEVDIKYIEVRQWNGPSLYAVSRSISEDSIIAISSSNIKTQNNVASIVYSEDINIIESNMTLD